MINILNAVAVTLLVAVLSVFPAALVGQHVPGFFNPTLKPIALAAWLSGLVSWYVARKVTRKQQVQEDHRSNRRTVGITVAFLAMAIGIVVALHFFGDRLLLDTLSAVSP